MIRANSGEHTMQKPHDADHCEINAPDHSHPDADCGHPVDVGPGTRLKDYNGAGNDDTVKDGKINGPGMK